MDTRKLTVETYACSCEEGVEYGLVIKQIHTDQEDGKEYVGDDQEASFMTVCRHEEQPVTDKEAYDRNGEQTILQELVRRWNAYSDLMAKLEELELRLTQARLASTIGRPKLKDADFLRGEMERIGQSARNLVSTLKSQCHAAGQKNKN
jgi:hypothetical protein